MAYLQFSKEKLSDLFFSINREIIQANHAGTYCSSSLINCNTRKYHGLLVAKQPQISDDRFVLFSALDETIIQKGKEINLATHKYPDVYYPKGYSYLEDFSYSQVPKWIIRLEGIEIEKEILLEENESRVLIRYTVKESKYPFKIKFEPLAAFRNIHTISRSNLSARTNSDKAENGIKLKLYPDYSEMSIQFSRKAEFIPCPEWNYSNEYDQERERGYDYQEDLFCPGFFKLSVKKGDQIILSAGLSEITSREMRTRFNTELRKKSGQNSFRDCLEKAAGQFIATNKNGQEINAGFHWFGKWGRDTFIALPGLTLATDKPEVCKKVIDTMLADFKNGLFPNIGSGDTASYNSADTSLWFIWAVQQYTDYTGSISKVWNEYGPVIKKILSAYRDGIPNLIKMHENGLLEIAGNDNAFTWMDAMIDGKSVTPRKGFVVEINALWYNAIHFSLEAAVSANDINHTNEWRAIPILIERNFETIFWNEDVKYLADCVYNQQQDTSLRPNQIFAVSLPYSPIKEETKKIIVDKIEEKLLTPRGIRTLSPDDKKYKGVYNGNQHERDLAYHQGTVWPWLLGPFSEAYIKVYQQKGELFIKSIYKNLEPAIAEYGIGTIAEIYDGDEPHIPRGAISQAWSVAELLRIRKILEKKGLKTVLKKQVEKI